MIYFLYDTAYGQYQLSFTKSTYRVDNTLAIEGLYRDAEFDCDMPFATLTVNLGDKNLKPNQAYVDTNNTHDLITLLEKVGVAERTDYCRVSGFCLYPLYEFDEKWLESIA